MRYVLLIPGWFPSEVNFLAGDFIERHARAASTHFPVKVLFVVKDETMPAGKIRLVHQQHGSNYETFIYYYSSGIPVGEKLFSAWMQLRCLNNGFAAITGKYGLPALIHAHVLIKYGWFALRKSQQYKIPLLASEQWTGYLPEATNEFERLGKFHRRSLKKIFANAVHVTTVSEYLAQQIRKRFAFAQHTVIPNLVDTDIFKPSTHQQEATTRFIHISTLSHQKNFEEVLAACQLLKSQQSNFILTVIAPPNRYEKKVKEMGLSSQVVFKKEVPQSALTGMVADSDALLLYSNYETFGCVIAEANACGVPVIVSDHPVFNENVIDSVTGLKAPLHQPGMLADRMLKIINRQHSFDKAQIVSITREKYGFEVIGKHFAEVYNRYAKP